MDEQRVARETPRLGTQELQPHGVRLIPCRGSGHHRQWGELDRPKPVGCGMTDQAYPLTLIEWIDWNLLGSDLGSPSLLLD